MLKGRAVVLAESTAEAVPVRAFPADDASLSGAAGEDKAEPATVDARTAEVLAAARAEADAVVAEARAAAAALREEARTAGQREGYATGYREGLEAARSAAAEIVEAARGEAERLRRESARTLARLACELAAHVVGVAIALDPELVEQAALALLDEARPLGVLSVAVAPADLEAARRARARWQADLGGEMEIALLPDPTLAPGCVRVETRSGTLERVWPQRLADIDRVMEEVAMGLGLDP